MTDRTTGPLFFFFFFSFSRNSHEGRGATSASRFPQATRCEAGLPVWREEDGQSTLDGHGQARRSTRGGKGAQGGRVIRTGIRKQDHRDRGLARLVQHPGRFGPSEGNRRLGFGVGREQQHVAREVNGGAPRQARSAGGTPRPGRKAKRRHEQRVCRGNQRRFQSSSASRSFVNVR